MFTISRIQLFLILFTLQTGTIFVTFQSRLIDASGPNAWIIFIVSGLLHYVLLVFFEKNHKRFNPGKFISSLYICYWLVVIIAFLAFMSYLLSVWIFPSTPQFIILAIIVVVSLYANLNKPESILNLPVLIIPLVFIFAISLFTSSSDLIWTWLFPIQITEYKSILKGFFIAQSTFIGIEVFLFLRRHVLENQSMKGLPILIYQSIWFIFFFTTLLFVLLFFPIEALPFIQEALLFILKAQKVTLLERLDLFFLFIWVIWSVITFVLYSFMCIHTHKIHFKQSKRFIILFHTILLIIPTFLASKDFMEILLKVIIYCHLFFALLLPMLLIVTDGRKKK